MDIFLVPCEAEHLFPSYAQELGLCYFLRLFPNAFKPTGVGSVFLALSLKMLGLNYPGLQAKLWKIHSQHLEKVFPPLKNSIHAP